MSNINSFDNIDNNEEYIFLPSINRFNRTTISLNNWHPQIKKLFVL